MEQRDNILQELKELNTQLTSIGHKDTYAVPAGYFDNLVEQVLKRIKALESANAVEELNHLSAELSKLSKQTPYSVPSGYFEGLDERMMQGIRESESFALTAEEEIGALSPLLAGLKKENVYSIPQEYFETLGKVNFPVQKEPAKVVSLNNRKWFRYAAAAILIGIIATFGIITIGKNRVSAEKDSYAWVKKNIKKVSTENLDEFIELTENEQSVASTDIKPQEVKEFIKDVPEDEIQKLLDDTRILDEMETNDAKGEESLMN